MSVILRWAAETTDFEASLFNVLRLPPVRALPPETKRRGLQIQSHQFDYISRRQIELCLDRVESCTVFPRHLDDAIYFLSHQVMSFHLGSLLFEFILRRQRLL